MIKLHRDLFDPKTTLSAWYAAFHKTRKPELDTIQFIKLAKKYGIGDPLGGIWPVVTSLREKI